MIYLDHNATTPVDSRVFDAMVPYLREHFGNASSYYQVGRTTKASLERARTVAAQFLGVRSREIIFTAGGTESDNLAVRGVAQALKKTGKHIITSSVEHHAVLRTCRQLEADGFSVTYLPVDGQGRVDPDDVRKNIRPDTIIISIIYANNETGVIQPVEHIGSLAREHGVCFHTDAVQAVGKLPVCAGDIFADLLSLSAHKLYGPKGVGALFVREGVPFASVITGGSHEGGFRAGTENIPGIIGLAEALKLAAADQEEETSRLAVLRDRLEQEIENSISDVCINGRKAPRVPNTSSISFRLIDGESVLLHLDLQGICASTGSACTTGQADASHVLLAMGVDPLIAQGTIRFSLGRGTTERDITTTVAALVDITHKLRSISSLKAL